MTLEAFGTVLSLKHRTHFTQCTEFKFTWFSLRSVFTFLRGQQTQVVAMRREQLSQLQWDNHHQTSEQQQGGPSLSVTQTDSMTGRVPTQLISTPTPLISLLLGVRTGVCEFKISGTQSLAWIKSQDYPGQVHFPTRVLPGSPPQALLEQRQRQRLGDHRQELG